MKNENTVILPIIIILVLFSSFGMMGFFGMGSGMMSGFHDGYSMGLFGWLVMALFIIILVLAITWLVKEISMREGK